MSIPSREPDPAVLDATAEPYPLPVELPQGVQRLAHMSDAEFGQRLREMVAARKRVQQIQKALMTDGVHYGTIPGTDRPTLFKAGAEVLLQPLRLVPDFRVERTFGDGQTAPTISVLVRCEVHVGATDGPVVGVGYGSANSWEKRYRYRRADRSCPQCRKPGTVIKGRAEFGGGWLCWPKKGGCGARFAADDERITAQPVGDVENPDPYDLENTLVKIGIKRAQIDATLRVTATSDLFTQDAEDTGPPPQRPAPASADEVETIRDLMDHLGLTNRHIQRGLERHGVSRIEDLPAAGARALLARLEQRAQREHDRPTRRMVERIEALMATAPALAEEVERALRRHGVGVVSELSYRAAAALLAGAGRAASRTDARAEPAA